MSTTYELSRDTLSVKISDLGARVEQIHWSTHHRNWLHSPSSEEEFAPFIFGIQPLFPPGRMAHGRFLLKGHPFEWPINDHAGPSNLHGFGWDSQWDVAQTTTDSVTLYLDNALVQKTFGGPFSLAIRYAVSKNNTFAIHAVMKNQGTIPLPAALGFHANIALRDDNYRCHFPAMEPWQIDDDKVPTGEKLPGLPKESKDARSICEDTPYHIVDGESNRVTLTSASGAFEAIFEGSNKFRQFVVYRPSLDANFLSIEPYSWLPNAPNLSLPDSDTGMIILNDGEEVTWDYSIQFRTLSPNE